MKRKVALVTGGNQGIGLEICRQLCHHPSKPFHVICTSRNSLSNAKHALGSNLDNIDFMQMDIGNNESIDDTHNHITNKYGKLDILINNAGIANKDSKSSSNSFNYNIVKSTFDINYFGTINITEKFFNLLLNNENDTDNDNNDNGKNEITKQIIFISSRVGSINKIPLKSIQNKLLNSNDDLTINTLNDIVTQFINDVKKLDKNEINQNEFNEKWWQSGYGMSKIAISAYSRILANMCKDSIWVGAYCPGWCKTNMTGIDSMAPRSAQQGAVGPTMLASLMNQNTTNFNRKYQTGNFWAVDFAKNWNFSYDFGNDNDSQWLEKVDWLDCKVPRR